MSEVQKTIQACVQDVLTDVESTLSDSEVGPTSSVVSGDPRLYWACPTSRDEIAEIGDVVADQLMQLQLGSFGIEQPAQVRKRIVAAVESELEEKYLERAKRTTPNHPATGRERSDIGPQNEEGSRHLDRSQVIAERSRLLPNAEPMQIDTDCPPAAQANASITFENQHVRAGGAGDAGEQRDTIVVAEAELPCGGFIDVHDVEATVGPSGTFLAGYPIGATGYLSAGTVHTNVCIDLFTDIDCIAWDREELSAKGPMDAMLHLDTDDDGTFTHYSHDHPPIEGTDHAYLCWDDNDRPDPIVARGTISPRSHD